MLKLSGIFNSANLSETKQKIAKNLFWAVLGKVVTLLGSLFVGIIIARYLGPEQYGLMNYVISYVLLFQTFATFGLDNIEIREEARRLENKDTIIGTAFCLKVAFAIITIMAIAATSYRLEADIYTFALVMLYSLSVVANTFNVIRNHFTSIVENEYVVKSEISRTVIGMGIKLILLWCGASLTWFIAAMMFDYILLAGGYYISYKNKIGKPADWHFNPAEAKYLIKESFPLMLTSAAVILYQRIDQVMIGQMIDKESVGYFSVASRFVDIIIYIPFILSDTISPILIKTRKVSAEQYRIKAQRFMNLTYWSTTIASALTALASYWLVTILFGKEYSPAVFILQILAFKAAGVAISTTAGRMIIIEGNQRYAIIRDLFGCLVCITLNYIFIPVYGITATAVIAIVCNFAAGYIADCFIPTFRPIFKMQTITLLYGWKDIINFKRLAREA